MTAIESIFAERYPQTTTAERCACAAMLRGLSDDALLAMWHSAERGRVAALDYATFRYAVTLAERGDVAGLLAFARVFERDALSEQDSDERRQLVSVAQEIVRELAREPSPQVPLPLDTSPPWRPYGLRGACLVCGRDTGVDRIHCDRHAGWRLAVGGSVVIDVEERRAAQAERPRAAKRGDRKGKTAR